MKVRVGLVVTVERLDASQTFLVFRHPLERNSRVVLADIGAAAVFRVVVATAGEASIRHVFLVMGPRDVLGLEQVNDGEDVGRGIVHIVVSHAKVVACHAGEVVGFRGVSGGVVVGQGNALFGNVVEVDYRTTQVSG